MSSLWLIYIFLIFGCISLYYTKVTHFTREIDYRINKRVILYIIPFYKSTDTLSSENELLIQLLLESTFIEIPIDISSDKIWYLSEPSNSSQINSFNKKCTPSLEELSKKKGRMYFSYNVHFTDVTFFIQDKSPSKENICLQTSSFGLAKTFDDQTFSIMEFFHKQTLPKMFSLHLDKNSHNFTKGTLYLGDVLLDKKSKSFKTITAKTVNLHKYWAININNVYLSIDKQNYTISSTYRIVNEPVIFDTIEEFILVPEQFMGYLNDILFYELLQMNQCKCVNEKGIVKYYCNENVVSLYKPSISFVINSQIFEITTDVLFNKQNNIGNEYNMLCIIVQSDKVKHITFGNLILKSLDEIVFNYEKEEILLVLYDNIVEITLNGEHKHYSDYAIKSQIHANVLIHKSNTLYLIVILISMFGIVLKGIELYKIKRYQGIILLN